MKKIIVARAATGLYIRDILFNSLCFFECNLIRSRISSASYLVCPNYSISSSSSKICPLAELRDFKILSSILPNFLLSDISI